MSNKFDSDIIGFGFDLKKKNMILIPDFIVILGPVTSRKCDTRQNIYRLMYTFTSNTSNASICTNDSVVTSFSTQVCSEPILSPKSSFKRVQTGIKPIAMNQYI